jgi:hypothetical protein
MRIHVCMQVYNHVCMHVECLYVRVYVLYVCNHSCEDICTSMSTYPTFVLLGAHARHVSIYSCMHTGIHFYTGMCVNFLMHAFMLMGTHACIHATKYVLKQAGM